MNNDELRNWYLALTDSDKQVFLALVSNHLTIHGRDFGLYPSGAEQSKAFNGLRHDRYPDDVLWKILDEKAAAYGLTAHLRQSLDFAKSRNCWDKSK